VPTKWDYRIIKSWWQEAERVEHSNGSVSYKYRHVWEPGSDVEEYCSGMTANLGSEGWELVTITTTSVSLVSWKSSLNDPTYGTFPVHQLYFKRPAVDS